MDKIKRTVSACGLTGFRILVQPVMSFHLFHLTFSTMRKASALPSADSDEHTEKPSPCEPLTQSETNESTYLLTENQKLRNVCEHIRQERDMLKRAMTAFQQSLPAVLLNTITRQI